ncbi:unnamed protein product [Pylaiella littoralis]
MTTSSHHHTTATKTAVDVTDMEQHDGPPISCPKSDNNCFFNSSIALGLAAFDGRQLIKYVMFDGSHLAERLLLAAVQARESVFASTSHLAVLHKWVL